MTQVSKANLHYIFLQSLQRQSKLLTNQRHTGATFSTQYAAYGSLKPPEIICNTILSIESDVQEGIEIIGLWIGIELGYIDPEDFTNKPFLKKAWPVDTKISYGHREATLLKRTRVAGISTELATVTWHTQENQSSGIPFWIPIALQVVHEKPFQISIKTKIKYLGKPLPYWLIRLRKEDQEEVQGILKYDGTSYDNAQGLNEYEIVWEGIQKWRLH